MAAQEKDRKHPEFGSLLRYGRLTYVPNGTSRDQGDSYFRYRIVDGEPCDEFRFYVYDNLAYRSSEFWLLDYFDDAHRACSSDRALSVMQNLWRWMHMYRLPRRAMTEACSHANIG